MLTQWKTLSALRGRREKLNTSWTSLDLPELERNESNAIIAKIRKGALSRATTSRARRTPR